MAVLNLQVDFFVVVVRLGWPDMCHVDRPGCVLGEYGSILPFQLSVNKNKKTTTSVVKIYTVYVVMFPPLESWKMHL